MRMQPRAILLQYAALTWLFYLCNVRANMQTSDLHRLKIQLAACGKMQRADVSWRLKLDFALPIRRLFIRKNEQSLSATSFLELKSRRSKDLTGERPGERCHSPALGK
jgi:hypothetical protein